MARNILQVSIKDGDDELNRLADFLRSGSVTSQSLEALRGYYTSLSVAESPESSREDRDKSLFKSLGLLKQQMCFLMDYHFRLDGTVVTPESFSTVVINPLLKEYGDSMWASTRSGNSANPTGDLQPDRSGSETKLSHPTYSSFCDTVDGLEMIGFDEPPSSHHGKNGSTFTTIDEPVTFMSQETVGQILLRENQARSDEIDREIANRSSDPSTDVEFFLEEVQPEPVEEYDPDHDPEDDLSEEEYLELVNSRMTVNIPVIVD
jgi:hypothetical protein